MCVFRQIFSFNRKKPLSEIYILVSGRSTNEINENGMKIGSWNQKYLLKERLSSVYNVRLWIYYQSQSICIFRSLFDIFFKHGLVLWMIYSIGRILYMFLKIIYLIIWSHSSLKFIFYLSDLRCSNTIIVYLWMVFLLVKITRMHIFVVEGRILWHFDTRTSFSR